MPPGLNVTRRLKLVNSQFAHRVGMLDSAVWSNDLILACINCQSDNAPDPCATIRNGQSKTIQLALNSYWRSGWLNLILVCARSGHQTATPLLAVSRVGRRRDRFGCGRAGDSVNAPDSKTPAPVELASIRIATNR